MANTGKQDQAAQRTPGVGSRHAGEVDSFFASRGRLLMDGPLAELAGLAEQIIAQAEALGNPQLVPEFKSLRDRANEIRASLRKAPEPAAGTEPRIEAPVPAGAESPTRNPDLPADPASAEPSSKGTNFLLKWLATQKEQLDSATLASARRDGPGHLLIVEDEPETQGLLSMLLQEGGYSLSIAHHGGEALEVLRRGGIDLVLLDLMLPEVNGYEVLEEMRNNPSWHNVPVIVLSGAGDMDAVVQCVELGAEEYLPKPFNPLLLRTRIAAGLEKKRLRDQEQAFLQQLNTEREKSERLLLNVLPAAIAERLKQGEVTIADSFPDATVLFADLANFTQLSEQTAPPRLVELLNEVFSSFDRLAEKHGVEKIKTIGDSYMVVGGLPMPCANHAERVALMGLDMQEAIREFNAAHHTHLALRVGINSGPVVAGIIGRRKFSYDLWGDTVNVASRMESHGQTGEIQVSESTMRKLGDLFLFEPRGPVLIKGKGSLPTYLLRRRQRLQP
jgi:class 3 adenylate cyclase